MHAYSFKYIVIGNSGVGKSSIVLRLTDGRFLPTFDFTIGVDFGVKTIRIKDKDIKLQIWDSAGQEAFRSITRSYYRGVAGVLLVYDITCRQSFNQITNWLEEIRRENPNHTPVIMLIGNKCDMTFNRHVTRQEGQDFANRHGLLFAETSAKLEDQNVYEVFSQIAEKVYDSILSGEIQPSDSNGIRPYGFANHILPLNKPSNETPSRWNSSFCCFQ